MGSKFEERTQDETLKQERRARRDAQELAKDVHKLRNESKDTFYSPAEVPAPSSTKGASMHMLSRKDLSSGELETLKRSRSPHNSGDSQWRGSRRMKKRKCMCMIFTFSSLCS